MILFLFLLHFLVNASNQNQCGIGDFDLSILTKKHGTSDWIYYTKNGKNTFYINVCANTLESCNGDLKPAPGVMNFDYKIPYACYNLGSLASQEWGYIEHGITVKYTGGDRCYVHPPISTYGMVIDFLCDTNVKEDGKIVDIQNKDPCTFHITFKTRYACSLAELNELKSHTGWSFIFLFLAFISLYFGVGIVYQIEWVGKTGWETIPNLEFWKSLPGLILDGIVFFFSFLTEYLIRCSRYLRRGGSFRQYNQIDEGEGTSLFDDDDGLDDFDDAPEL